MHFVGLCYIIVLQSKVQNKNQKNSWTASPCGRPRSVLSQSVGSVVGKVTLARGFLRVIPLPLVTIIPPIPHAHSSFLDHPRDNISNIRRRYIKHSFLSLQTKIKQAPIGIFFTFQAYIFLALSTEICYFE